MTQSDNPPTKIELTEENYTDIWQEEDGTLVLELSEQAAQFLYEEGFTRDDETGGLDS